jgi:cysteine synthase
MERSSCSHWGLMSHIGVFVGPSAALNVAAAVKLARKLGELAHRFSPLALYSEARVCHQSRDPIPCRAWSHHCYCAV